jgi:hypothetical protein
LLIAEWNQTVTVGHNNAGFSACGNCPCDQQKIHDHAFSISNRAVDESNSTAAAEGAVNITKTGDISQHSSHRPAPILLLLATHLPCPTGGETETAGSQEAEGSDTDFSGTASGNCH